LIDIGGNDYHLFRFSAIEENKQIQALQSHYVYVPVESGKAPIVPVAQPTDALLVDVREPWEYEECHEDTHVNIPLYELSDRVDEWVVPGRPVVFFCPSGKRSRIAVELAKQQGVTAYAKRLG